MERDYELRVGDFIPFKGYNEYRQRNALGRIDLIDLILARGQLLIAYNALIGLTGVVALGAAIEGLEKILR